MVLIDTEGTIFSFSAPCARENRDRRFFKDHPIISLNVIFRAAVIEFKILLAIGLYGELQRRPDQVFVLTGHRPFITVARPGDFVSRDGI